MSAALAARRRAVETIDRAAWAIVEAAAPIFRRAARRALGEAEEHIAEVGRLAAALGRPEEARTLAAEREALAGVLDRIEANMLEIGRADAEGAARATISPNFEGGSRSPRHFNCELCGVEAYSTLPGHAPRMCRRCARKRGYEETREALAEVRADAVAAALGEASAGRTIIDGDPDAPPVHGPAAVAEPAWMRYWTTGPGAAL